MTTASTTITREILSRSHWHDRIRAAGIHLTISLGVAALAALLVFGLWYPYPYREISGGRELFMLVVAVDVVLGPLLTFAIFNRAKPQRELVRDLIIVALLQLAGLSYGLSTVFVARPVYLAFEFDRFHVIHAVDIDESMMNQAPPGIKKMPLLGPTLVAVRPFKNSNEGMEATLAALQGVALGARPDLWQPYGDAKARVIAASQPVGELTKRFAAQSPETARLIADAVARTGRPATALRYLPLAGRKSFWTVLIDPDTAEPVGFLPVDSF